MAAPTKATDALHARQRFRLCGCHVLRHPADIHLHHERLEAALALAGAEPVQGALADFFAGCSQASPSEKISALGKARARLSPWVATLFDQYLGDEASYPRCSRMATRWSVLTTPSLDMPRRALRCSYDDAEALAQAAVTAWRNADAEAEAAFLTHCTVCGDTLAFTLARRALLREISQLPGQWEATYLQLQEWVLAS